MCRTCTEATGLTPKKTANTNARKKIIRWKLLSGAGRLTDKKIDLFQNYFGLAIRQNKGDLLGLQQSVFATLHYYLASTDSEPNHSFCPTGPESWCKYQNDQENYKHKHGLPRAIVELVEPMFIELADCDLLKKCLHGKTQNNNESINNMIWRYCPKEDFVSRITLTDAANFAVAVFNDGTMPF